VYTGTLTEGVVTRPAKDATLSYERVVARVAAYHRVVSEDLDVFDRTESIAALAGSDPLDEVDLLDRSRVLTTLTTFGRVTLEYVSARPSIDEVVRVVVIEVSLGAAVVLERVVATTTEQTIRSRATLHFVLTPVPFEDVATGSAE
jgi:hypothetical protein